MFIACPPQNIFLLKCLEVYEEMFHKHVKYTYWGHSIVTVFDIARVRIGIDSENLPLLPLLEKCPTRDWRDCLMENEAGEIIMKNRTADYDACTHSFT